MIKVAIAALLMGSTAAVAQTHWADWPMTQTPDAPGVVAADSLLPKPAGAGGVVRVADGHFFTGDRRVKFWGVNLAFAANFPTHDQADRLARRFARFGINAVRFHHMDNQPFPNGIFADASLERLSDEALDRLDYFIAALKRQGVYADLNLHVSRSYRNYHKPDDGHPGPAVDKIVDLFGPELIESQKRYAYDLLTHVNAYTHARYADEPAVGIVEINNENSLFMWGAEQTLRSLPAPYDAQLKRQWNRWLVDKYKTRDALAKAWSAGEEPLGDDQLKNEKQQWHAEVHAPAAMSLSATDNGRQEVAIEKVDGTPWHLQLVHPGLKLKKGGSYVVTVELSADENVSVDLNVGQSHEPWSNLGLAAKIDPAKLDLIFQHPLTALADEDNARLSLVVGNARGTIRLGHVAFYNGGRIGLGDEDPTQGTVRTSVALSITQARHDDWYQFLEQTEQDYYTDMRDYLHHDLGVKMPVTGTIGFGPIGTMVQAKMDFVDAHAYWQHPVFPRKQWDAADWRIPNESMTSHPHQATLWGLAATRVAGLPFTVTEYQHPAPNDFQAECIPTIAAYAAAQDWDGIFIFAYSHDARYEKGTFGSFFDIEDNAAKMPLMPMGARLFLGSAVKPAADAGPYVVQPSRVIAVAPAYETDFAAYLRRELKVDGLEDTGTKVSIRFDEDATHGRHGQKSDPGPFGSWDGPAAVVRLRTSPGDGIDNDFSTVIVVSSDPAVPIESAKELLISAVGRVENTGMKWDADRHTVGTHWGRAPARIDVITGELRLLGKWSHAYPLDPTGQPTDRDVATVDGGQTIVHLGQTPAQLYVVRR